MGDPAPDVWGFPGQGVAWSMVAARLEAGADDDLVRRLVDRTGVRDWAEVDPADTRLAQPGILTASLLEATTRPSDGVEVLVGHSFGELAALVVAGVLDVSQALDLAIARGEAGATALAERGGGMLAVVGVDEWEVEHVRRLALQAADGIVEVAVRNHHLQVVLSGDPPALDRVRDRVLATTEGRAHVLPIGGPFHSPFMADAAASYRESVASMALAPPRIPVVISTNTRQVTGEDD
ncbi:MAG: ACP S-malonyltransferase, partial [Actinomycetota bacterium]